MLLLCRCEDSKWTGDRCDVAAIFELELQHGKLCQLHCVSEKFKPSYFCDYLVRNCLIRAITPFKVIQGH